MLEYQNLQGKHFRARQNSPVVPFPDGTIISFTGNQIALAQNEWFLIKQITEIFSAFAAGQVFPSFVEWKELDANYITVG